MTDNSSPIPSTARELYELLSEVTSSGVATVDHKTLKYAIYARKSTTGDERQERSIPDQIADCISKVVTVDGLKVVGKPIEEKCSAKDPDIRPKFKQLLEDIRSEKIDGIIAWHPDRLSRNMKEAGEIIDLLDKGVLKDLRFATSTFENSPTGKMLLGISFVLSKQYSEHLSESVVRGNKRKTEDGIFFDDMKHGYFISDGRLYPDGENFTIIREIFERRLDGWSNPDIARWLNAERAQYRLRKKDKNPAPYKWDKETVGKVLKDPVYAGVLKYGNHLANLEEHYDFTPPVTVEEFFKVNKIKDFSSSKIASATMSKKRETTKADLLRGRVICGYCNKPFSSGLTPKMLKDGKAWYYLYKCETDGCDFKGKSVRARFILDYAYDFLDKCLFTTKSNYEHFLEEARQNSIQTRKEIKSSILGLSKILGDKRQEYENAKKTVAANPDLKEHYDLTTIKKELNTIEAQAANLVQQRDAAKQAPVTYKQYLELFSNLSVKLQESDDMELLDQVLRKFFSNFVVKSVGKGKQQRCEITHKLNEPWDGFIKSGDVDCGRSTDTANEPVLEALYSLLLNYETLKNRLSDLRELIATLVKPEAALNREFLL